MFILLMQNSTHTQGRHSLNTCWYFNKKYDGIGKNYNSFPQAVYPHLVKYKVSIELGTTNTIPILTTKYHRISVMIIIAFLNLYFIQTTFRPDMTIQALKMSEAHSRRSIPQNDCHIKYTPTIDYQSGFELHNYYIQYDSWAVQTIYKRQKTGDVRMYYVPYS